MVAEPLNCSTFIRTCCSLAKISMVAEQAISKWLAEYGCSLAKISMVAERIYP